MIHPNVGLLIETIVATAAITIVLFFLPALIELKKPQDAGPRLISDNVPQIGIAETTIIDIEETRNFTYQSTIEIAFSLSALLTIEG